jgi:hypothetical protein
LQFQEYWRNKHAPIGYRFPGGPGYRQLHTATDDQAEYYDGITLMQYPDAAFLQRGFESVDYLREVAADEEKFLDHTHSSVMYYNDVSRYQLDVSSLASAPIMIGVGKHGIQSQRIWVACVMV